MHLARLETPKIMKGKRIRNLTELIRAADEKRSVIMANCHCGIFKTLPAAFVKTLPATFVLSMPAILVAAELEHGLYIYKPKHSKRPIRNKQ